MSVPTAHVATLRRILRFGIALGMITSTFACDAQEDGDNATISAQLDRVLDELATTRGELQRQAELSADPPPVDDALDPPTAGDGLHVRAIPRAVSHPLQNSTWTQGDPTTTAWRTILFGETTITLVEPGVPIQTYVADFGGHHFACLDVPHCVVSIEPSGAVVRHLFSTEDGHLLLGTCVEYAGDIEGDSAALQDSERIIYRDGNVVCVPTESGEPYQRVPR